ncbi:MAG TPA: double zinc ribbon domain-containing protein, partial [Rhodoblastus sp.]|nr:double zinc ribbon domain-containing protein [Rhodoblastus sp.]
MRARLATALTPIAAIARRTGARALDIVYPPVCISCRRAASSHFGLCPDCWT